MEMAAARQRLEEMRDDLDHTIAVLQDQRPAPAAGAGYPQDAADAGAALSEADRTDAVLDSARTQREQVLAALSRIEQRTYGRCADCGREIPDGRLDARPDADRCVSCQSARNRR